MAAGEPILYSLYVYAPNKGAPIFFTIAYAISAAFHIWQCHRYKAFKLIGWHPVCAVLFTAGYALREYGAYNYIYDNTTNTPLIIFILSQVFIYVCPPLLELANYHILSHLFHHAPNCSPFPPSTLLRTFTLLMSLIETLNALGVSLSANPSSSPHQQSLGTNLTLSALALQLAAIASFVCLAAIFHLRCANAGLFHPSTNPSRGHSVKKILLTLYASMGLILTRCVYRLVEHTTGTTKITLDDMDSLRRLSPVLRYEAFFYVFEATLMLGNSVVWNLWNAARLLAPNSGSVCVSSGTDVVVAGGEEEGDEKRPLLRKVVWVLTLGVFCEREEKMRGSGYRLEGCSRGVAGG
ncbi:MAG: hypothetical protein Q9227_005913 [Pyrenula ochraceoflavens]